MICLRYHQQMVWREMRKEGEASGSGGADLQLNEMRSGFCLFTEPADRLLGKFLHLSPH